jgi:hypothetical protein
MNVLLTFLAICLALAGGFLILSRPMWAFVLVMLIFVVEQLLQSYFGVFRANQTLFNYMVAAVAVLAAGIRLSRRDPVTVGFNTPITWLIYAQYALWLFAMIYTPAPDMALMSLQAHWPYLVLFLIVTPFLVSDLTEIHKSLIGMMVVGAAIAVLIMFNPRSVYYAGRLTLDLGMIEGGRYSNVLALAQLGGYVALIAGLITPIHARRPFMVLRIACLVIGLGLAIGSGSRGQVLATVVAGVMFYPLARRVNSVRNFFFTSIGLLLLCGIMYATFQLFIGDQNRTRWDVLLMIRDIGQRFDLCRMFIDALYASPSHWALGLGTSSWTEVIGDTTFAGNYVHNIAVEILCEHGLIGAGIFVLTTFLVIREGIRMWWVHRHDPPMRSAAALLMAFCAFSLFNELKEGTMSSGFPFFLWLILGKIAQRETTVHAAELPVEEDAVDHIHDHQTAREYAMTS